MKVQMYTIKDVIIGAYLEPFMAATDKHAWDMISATVNDPDHVFHDNAHDFQLWSTGTFDTETGDMQHEPPIYVANLSQMMVNANA